MEKIKKTLLIDVDEVISEPTFLDEVNAFLKTSYKMEDFTEYYIDDVLGSDANKARFYESIKNKDMYANSRIFRGAKTVLKKLSKVYDIYICSACVMFCMPKDSGIFFKHKYDFLINNFPFLDPNKFIFTSAKNLFRADVQIDDKLSNMQGDVGLKLMFSAYHNKNVSDETLKKEGAIRVDSWADIEKILL